MEKKNVSILIIDDDEVLLKSLEKIFTEKGYYVRVANDGEKGISMLEAEPCDIVLTDLSMPGMSGIDVLKFVKSKYPDIEVILITGQETRGTIGKVAEAMKFGALDFIEKQPPLDPEKIYSAIDNAMRQRNMNLEWLNKDHSEKRKFLESMLGGSEPMQKVYWLIEKVAPSNGNVLIMGESGTGKELTARAIHALSPRREKPFIPVSCGALTETLLESELFGHVKGSFTGALATKYGLFEVAEGGTIFLDEIGEISHAIQVKLLRVLQEREIKRVGSTTSIKVDVRVIAATNRNLMEEIQKGNFRKDLYYRLNVVSIEIPPLRARKDDIPQLAYHFIAKYSNEVGKTIKEIDPKALKILQQYDWPGNVRELENVIERAAILTNSNRIQASDLPDLLTKSIETQPSTSADIKTIEELQKEHILQVLESVNNNKAEAARILGINRATLYRKIKSYGIE